jgi:hypothetical protein
MSAEDTQPTRVKAGKNASPGKYVCIDCGHEIQLSETEKDLKKCPTCACEEYNCFPMTHIRPDVKTAEDALNPPKTREYMGKKGKL